MPHREVDPSGLVAAAELDRGPAERNEEVYFEEHHREDVRARHRGGHQDLFVTPGSEGCVLLVAKIVQVHISLRRLENFWQLAEAGKVRRMGLVGGYGKVCCGQGNQSFTTCGMLLPEDSGELYKSCERSNAGIWYCKECMQRVRGGGFFV